MCACCPCCDDEENCCSGMCFLAVAAVLSVAAFLAYRRMYASRSFEGVQVPIE
ncbi:MAG: hypothetical protein QF415_06310 [Candidatus Undinarchaeales archaeon]|nr:hypothetical protein [Candidatus Undinarchaeales archaeon]MDP7492027.1 hypothetical protein [Candidatus Undinarchaeales archaeon]